MLLKADMKTRVVHCKKEPYDIYIGRPSMWGNPYQLGIDGNRDVVLALYKTYIYTKLKQMPDFALRIKTLRGKTLGCWCSPLPCHGDILAELADASEG